jgi:hypothetical protein
MSRAFLPSSGTPSVSPAFASIWESTGSADRMTMVLAKTGTTAATKTISVDNQDCLFRQYVSEPLAAGCVFTAGDFIKGQIRCSEVNTDANQTIVYSFRVYSEDGSTQRVLLRGGTESTEFATTLTNISITNTVANSYTTVDGDRLVFEVGANRGSALRNGSMSFGDVAGSDLPEDETTTTALDPWIEFPSTTLTLKATIGTDTATLSEGVPGIAPGPATDSGTLSESASIGITDTDGATLADTSADLQVTDPAAEMALTDAGLVTVSDLVSETASLSESGSVAAALPVLDTASLGESLGLAAVFGLTDGGTLSENAGIGLNPSDSGAFAESAVVTQYIFFTGTVSGTPDIAPWVTGSPDVKPWVTGNPDISR